MWIIRTMILDEIFNFHSHLSYYFFLSETHNQGFSKDICRSMVAMLDVDHSGKLGFEEFKTLWNDIRKWRVGRINN